MVRGEPRRELAYRLGHAEFLGAGAEVEIVGLEACRHLFGAVAPSQAR